MRLQSRKSVFANSRIPERRSSTTEAMAQSSIFSATLDLMLWADVPMVSKGETRKLRIHGTRATAKRHHAAKGLSRILPAAQQVVQMTPPFRYVLPIIEVQSSARNRRTTVVSRAQHFDLFPSETPAWNTSEFALAQIGQHPCSDENARRRIREQPVGRLVRADWQAAVSPRIWLQTSAGRSHLAHGTAAWPRGARIRRSSAAECGAAPPSGPGARRPPRSRRAPGGSGPHGRPRAARR
jgi:hypothetical protein